MTLSEAIEEVKRVTENGTRDKGDFGDVEDWANDKTPAAIATILNAVMKGELK